MKKNRVAYQSHRASLCGTISVFQTVDGGTITRRKSCKTIATFASASFRLLGVRGPGAGSRGVRTEVPLPALDMAALRPLPGVAAQSIQNIPVPLPDTPGEVYQQLCARGAHAVAWEGGGERGGRGGNIPEEKGREGKGRGDEGRKQCERRGEERSDKRVMRAAAVCAVPWCTEEER